LRKYGGKMEKAFIFGLSLGMLGGALIVANSCKMRKVVINSQEDLLAKIEKLSEERDNKTEKKSK